METTAQVHARLSTLPRAALGFFPTPFHRAENLSRELGIDLWIKRDDLTGMSLFGGNKVRKLEYVLGEARARGCDTVVSYGATQSNCAMQVATACRRLGMRPILYLVAIVEPAELRANLLLDYVLAFSFLGLACVFAKPFKNKLVGVAVGSAAVCVLRFLCSFLSGVLIWGNLSDGLPAWIYSLTYNGSYMLPEIVITAVLSCVLVPWVNKTFPKK